MRQVITQESSRSELEPSACEVCECLTFQADSRGDFSICPVCYWEDDEYHTDPDEPCGGPNHGLSINQAKQNFRKYGAITGELAKHTRAPKKEEMPADIQAAYEHSWHHREEIKNSKLCGCYHCLAIFSPDKIVEWAEDDTCAMCPKCGIDAVLGDTSSFPITEEFLTRMKLYWFDK